MTLLFIPFSIIATANAAGYRYGASDQAFYTPAILQRLDPALFPGDTALLNAQARLTLADETVATLVRMSGLRLPTLFAVLYLLGFALIACAVSLVGGDLYRERWTAVALLAAIALRHAIARAGTNTLEGYFHPRQLAFALGLLALCAFLKRRYIAVLLLLAAAATLHPTTTLWFGVWLCGSLLLAERRWRGALAVATVAAVPVAWWTLSAGPLAGRLTTMDPVWFAAIADKNYLFPFEWPAYAWVFNLGYPVIILVMWRMRRSAGLLHPRETALALGSLSLVIAFAIALIFQSRVVALAIQLQPARVFWMLDFLATVYLVWWVAEGRGGAQPRRAVIVAAALAVGGIVRGVYIMQVQFPDRPLVEIGIRDDDWGRAMRWARTTDRGSGWLADPLHAARYGTSVRVAGERAVFVEAIKDSALAMYDRNVALRTRERLEALGDFQALTAARAGELARSYDLDFLVTESVMPLPVVFESGALRVYRIGGVGP